MIRHLFFIPLLLISFFSFAQKSLLTDKELQAEIREGLDLMYNSKFNEAERIFKKIYYKLPNHPISPLLMALNVGWKHFPVESDKLQFDLYKKYLTKSLEASDKILDKNDKSIEGIFFSLSVHSQLAKVYSEDGDYLSAVSEAGKAYELIKKGFDLKDRYNEFYFTSGLYNYYRIQYPNAHPIYKPFVLLFTDGDKQKGLSELEVAAKEALFTSTEAYYYLSNIHLRYESKPELALKYTKVLTDKYPDNLFFVAKHVEALIFLKRYNLIQPYLDKIKASTSPFFKISGEVFTGALEEHSGKDLKSARAYYVKSISSSHSFKKKAANLKSLAYLGLGRIALKEGDHKKAQAYFKRALDLAEYEWMKKEAKGYLKKEDA